MDKNNIQKIVKCLVSELHKLVKEVLNNVDGACVLCPFAEGLLSRSLCFSFLIFHLICI